MRDLLVTMIVFGSIPFILKRPHIGILMWCWLSYMNPHRLSWGWAFNYPFATWIGAITLVAWLLSREPKLPPSSPTTAILAIFTGWITLTTYFAMVPDYAWSNWDTAIKILVMTFASLVLMNTKDRLQALVWVIALSLAYYGVKGGIFTVMTGGAARVWGPPRTFISDNNHLAAALIMVAPLVWYLGLRAKERWLQWAFYGATGLIAIAIIGSHSRGALLGLIGMVSVLWLKSRHKFITGLVLIVGIGGALSFMPEHWFERMHTIQTYDEDLSVQGRFDLWLYAFNVALDRPLFGGGFGVFLDPELYDVYNPDAIGVRNVHSIYFEVLGAHGFVGLLLYLAMWASALINCSWVLRRTRNRPDLFWARDLAAMLQVSIIGFLIGGAFLNLAFFDLPYHVVVMTILNRKVVAKTLEEEQAAEKQVEEAIPLPEGRRMGAYRPSPAE